MTQLSKVTNIQKIQINHANLKTQKNTNSRPNRAV